MYIVKSINAVRLVTRCLVWLGLDRSNTLHGGWSTGDVSDRARNQFNRTVLASRALWRPYRVLKAIRLIVCLGACCCTFHCGRNNRVVLLPFVAFPVQKKRGSQYLWIIYWFYWSLTRICDVTTHFSELHENSSMYYIIVRVRNHHHQYNHLPNLNKSVGWHSAFWQWMF